jgi:hypothetical protein
MTPQQLQAINGDIYQHLQNNPQCRLLIHALDRNLLSDENYQLISSHGLAEEQLREAPWAMALFWGRLFYEKSDGNNYRRIIQDGLGIAQPDELFEKIHRTCGWFPVDDEILFKPVYRFQAECWLTSEEGETSRLWKSLPRLIRNAILGATNEQICEVAGADEEDITPPIRWLLKKHDPDFCDTLRWLHGGVTAQEGGAPVNAVACAIAKNPINARTRKNDDCDASFGLRVSDHRAELVLGIRNLHFGEYDPGNTRNLEITQDRQTLLSTFVGKQSRSIILGPDSFAQRTDFSRSLGFRLGNKTLDASDIIPLPWGGNYLLLFRKSYDGDFSRFIASEVDGRPSHVQGRYFYLLGRPDVEQSPELNFGGNPLPLTPCGTIEHAGIVRHLFRLDLGMLHGEPLPLIEPGATRPLAIIGRKSFLSIDTEPSGWQLHGGNETPVFIGCTRLTLTPENFVGNQIGISVSDQQGNHLPCEPLPNDPSKFGLSIGRNHWGKEWRIRATSENPGDTASTEILFLPGLDVPDVQWTPSQVEPSLRFSLAQHHGLEDGTLSYPGGARPVLRPIQNPTWAWKDGPIGFPEDFDGHKEFADHQDIASWKVEYVLPRGGNWTLKFNDEASSSDQGRASLTDLVTNHINPEEMGGNLDVLDQIQIVCLSNSQTNPPRPVATIWRNPVHPVVGVVNGHPSIYVPTRFNASGWRLLLLTESDVLTGGVHNLDVGNIPPGNTHPINGLPDLKPDEGAWLVLLEMGNLIPPIESLEIFSYILPCVVSSGICRITEEGTGQTFPMLLQIWLGEHRELTEEERRIVRSRLDLLDCSMSRMNGAQGLGCIFARARRDRHLLGFGSWNLLIRFFEERLPGVLDEGSEALHRLLHMLLECGFNWFAEPDWIDNLPTRIKELLQGCGQKFTSTKKKILKEVCPLVGSFDLIHQGLYREIPRIDGELFLLPRTQPEIGVTIAAPGSTVPSFIAGFPYRGIYGNPEQGRLLVQRSVSWPTDHRKPIELMDTHGMYFPIILRVTDRNRASSYLSDKIGGPDSSLFFDGVTKDRMRDIFQSALSCSGSLLGSIENPGQEETQLAVLFLACSDRFEIMAEEESGQESRATIYQAAVMSRLHAWVTEGNLAPVGWPLNDPASYDLLARVMATIWSSPDHRKALEKDIAPIEWLITWFKNPDFHP